MCNIINDITLTFDQFRPIATVINPPPPIFFFFISISSGAI